MKKLFFNRIRFVGLKILIAYARIFHGKAKANQLVHEVFEETVFPKIKEEKPEDLQQAELLRQELLIK